ncbi:cupin domain-containing protein [Anaerotignum sp.]|uniref:cupin domain-containing protein n=1 Tax=Anaerotignum sp. TaxID=2039241 RepID=UPI00271541CB|nr:cupin domain-containing protein [Anaerotignum sp.]
MFNQNNFNEMEWEFVREGVKRKVFTGEGATLSLNELQFGHTPKPHTHIHEQVVYILQGEADFFVDGVKHEMKAGGLLVIPSNVEHYIVVTSKEPVLNLDVFTPKRADYL